MSERSIYLYCTEGGSDKEYHLHLRARICQRTSRRI